MSMNNQINNKTYKGKARNLSQYFFFFVVEKVSI